MKLLPAGWLLCALTALFSSANARANEAEIRATLTQRLPANAKIEEVRKTPVDGIYEVRINADDIYYSDRHGTYIFHGNLINTETKANLTVERVAQLHPIRFDALPLTDAITTVRGTGARKIVLFADPNCGFCKRFEETLKGVDNITVHTYLIPILGPDSKEKVRNLWCASDKARAWEDWMLRAVLPPTAQCDGVAAIDRNLSFAARHKVSATPTAFFADGTRAVGPLGAQELEARLTATAQN